MVTTVGNSQDNYQINTLSLNGIDLRNEFLALATYENIFVNDITLSIDLLEVESFMEIYDFSEGAELVFSYFTRYPPYTLEMELFENTFHLYNIERVKAVGQSKKIYRMNFVTKEAHKNDQLKISRSYRDKPTSDIITSAFSFLESDAGLNIEPSDDFIPLFVVPNLTPYQTINLMNRSALKAGMNDYVFFRDKLEYVCKPISILMEQGPILDYIMDQTSLEWQRDKQIEHRNIMDYHTDRPQWNSLESISSGWYGSKMFVRNVLTKTHEFIDNPGKPTEFSSPDNHHINESDNYYNRELIRDYRQDRLEKTFKLNEHRMVLTVPDNTDLTVGKMINLAIPTTKEGSITDPSIVHELDLNLSGDYLISKLKHEVSQVDSKMVLEVIKKV